MFTSLYQAHHIPFQTSIPFTRGMQESLGMRLTILTMQHEPVADKQQLSTHNGCPILSVRQLVPQASTE